MLQFLLESNRVAGLNSFFSWFLLSRCSRSWCGLVCGGSRLNARVHFVVCVKFIGGKRSSEVDCVYAVIGFEIELIFDLFSLVAGYYCEFWCND